jgi:hypothetical protein
MAYHLRPFRNGVLDLHAARLLTGPEAEATGLSYGFVDQDVPPDVLRFLERAAHWIGGGVHQTETGAACHDRIRTLAAEAESLVADCVITTYFDHQGYVGGACGAILNERQTIMACVLGYYFMVP